MFGDTVGVAARQQVDRLLKRTASVRPVESAVAAPFLCSHRPLLTPLDRVSREGGYEHVPGAIVVPTARPPAATRSGLRFAARLALENGCPLVVLASQEAGTAAAVDTLGEQILVPTHDGPARPDTLVLRTSHRGTPLTSFGVDDLTLSKEYRRGGSRFREGKLRVNDVGRKRNLALLLAAGQQWRSVLFVDDDIFDVEDGDGRRHEAHERTLRTPALKAAVRAIEEHEQLAVGWAARGFDDNSVLCRIAGAMGAPQDQFIGAGALLVPIGPDTAFFPSIYNDDWLFLLGLLRRRSAGARELLHGGDVHQDEYPAYQASRAAAEELGDTLGEGLMSLAHECRAGEPPSAAFWRHALANRREFRQGLEHQVRDSKNELREEMLRALATVRTVQQRIADEESYWVAQFVTYGKRWVKDLEAWGRRLHPDDLPRPDRLVQSREFDAARCYGRFSDPHQFLREVAGEGAADATRSEPVAV